MGYVRLARNEHERHKVPPREHLAYVKTDRELQPLPFEQA
jgi:hypothetical protein